MATASKVHLEASQKPQFHVEGLTSESAEKTSQLLQTNHEQHHIFFNHDGFHNHIAHHLLTLFALNATPEELQKAYDNNVTYQRPAEPLKKTIVNDMHDPSRFATYLGKEKYYHDFLVYFQGEIEKKGWQATLQEHVFSGTEQADDMLVRMFAGFLHPIIHLGFGIEFQQPAIIAEALAQAAVHDEWMKSLFFGCEKAASQRRGEKNTTSIVEILEQCRQDEKLKGSAKFSDANKIRDGILKRAPDEMIEYATRYRVSEEELEKKTAEMIDASVFFTASSQHPPHQIKFDFFYMHCVTSSIFFSAFLSPSSSLPTSAQRRLLEWKVWNDITMYVSRGSPALLIDEIKNYKPTRDASIQDVIQRVRKIEDDGHASKLVRALANGAQVCRKWEADEETMKIRGDMWRVIANMAIDSVEAGEPQWVRSCGFDEAWEKVPVREGATSESGSRL